MKQKPVLHFNVYDVTGLIRQDLDLACKKADMNRSMLVRHAVREYIQRHKLA